MALNYTKLGGSSVDFQQMIQRFGVVTVMNAEVYQGPDSDTLTSWKAKQANEVILDVEANGTLLTKLDTLKIANVSQEGPTKTITGGQYANPLIKFGKTARLEMQDALGNAMALDALCGTISETDGEYPDADGVYALHVGGDFEGPKTIIGDSFFIDQKSGQQVKVKIIFYQFLPDSLFNLTQDSEGDATVFDMNGDLLVTDILVSQKDGTKDTHGLFYSIVDPGLVDDSSN